MALFFQRRSNSAFAKISGSTAKDIVTAAQFTIFTFQLFQTLTFSGGESTITAPVSRSCWRTQTRRVSGVQPIFEQWNKLPPIVSDIRPDFPEPYELPVDGLRGKNSIFSHPVYLFLRKFSLRDFGAVHRLLPTNSEFTVRTQKITDMGQRNGTGQTSRIYCQHRR